MKSHNLLRRRAAIPVIGAFVLFAVLAAVWLRAGQTAARAGNPPPDQPQFDGLAVVESFPVTAGDARPASLPAGRLASGWEVIFSEDWEEGFDDDVWLTLDRNGALNGEFKWGVREIANPLGGGEQSAWSIGGGQDGQNHGLDDGYPANVDSWLIYGPVNMSLAYDAELSFNYWFQADAGEDVYKRQPGNRAGQQCAGGRRRLRAGQRPAYPAADDAPPPRRRGRLLRRSIGRRPRVRLDSPARPR